MPLHGLEHVLVLTDDLEATKTFYCEVLGFDAGDRPPLEFPGYRLYLDGVPCVRSGPQAAAVAVASGAFPRIRSAAFSAIMIVAAFVFARVMVGITEASTTRRPSTP